MGPRAVMTSSHPGPTGSPLPAPVPFADQAEADPAVRGWLHAPAVPAAGALVLTHGAGSDCRAPLLVAMAEAFARHGVLTLRCDLPYRQASPAGPPSPATAARDRAGLRRAVLAVRVLAGGRVFLGGHSYGGRQASLLAADEPELADALLLLAYPLHPPRRPAERRTAHFPRLKTRALFVHGSRDPFGAIVMLRAALALIPTRTALLAIDGAGHALWPPPRAAAEDALPTRVVAAFEGLLTEPPRPAATGPQ
jgi:predicted alpha/beta-hydrolase family hydrolase